jgi:hypothetical protein
MLQLPLELHIIAAKVFVNSLSGILFFSKHDYIKDASTY